MVLFWEEERRSVLADLCPRDQVWFPPQVQRVTRMTGINVTTCTETALGEQGVVQMEESWLFSSGRTMSGGRPRAVQQERGKGNGGLEGEGAFPVLTGRTQVTPRSLCCLLLATPPPLLQKMAARMLLQQRRPGPPCLTEPSDPDSQRGSKRHRGEPRLREGSRCPFACEAFVWVAANMPGRQEQSGRFQRGKEHTGSLSRV